MKTLDIEAVQAFVLTADLKSFTRAAEAMDTTQSAVSLKIKRLEHGLGRADSTDHQPWRHRYPLLAHEGRAGIRLRLFARRHGRRR